MLGSAIKITNHHDNALSVNGMWKVEDKSHLCDVPLQTSFRDNLIMFFVCVFKYGTVLSCVFTLFSEVLHSMVCSSAILITLQNPKSILYNGSLIPIF